MLRLSSWRVGWAAALAVVLLLAACGSGGATPTLAPVAVTIYAAGTPTPPGAQPSTPASANPGGSETPPPPADATAIPVYGPDSYPENVNPLTGQVVDPAKISRYPVAVKISNFPYAVRPQWGLAAADLVFEHLAEAGVTRFTAVFLQNDAPKVGSIRSARFIDTEIAAIFKALLVTSGSSLGTMEHLRFSAWFAGDNVWRLVSEETRYVCPPLCRETPDDTNTLFAGTDQVRESAAGAANARQDLGGLAFSAAVPAGGQPVSDVLVDFSLAAHVSWRYNAGGLRYTRWQDKDPSGEMIAHLDAATNAPITAANVVVLQVSHVNNFVPEDFRDGGNCGLEIQLWTAGPAKIFRDGQMFEGRWRRDAGTGMKLRLEDNAGNAIPLRPGNTWFDVVTLNANLALNGATYVVTNKVPDTRAECPVPPTETPTVTPEGYVAPTETPKP